MNDDMKYNKHEEDEYQFPSEGEDFVDTAESEESLDESGAPAQEDDAAVSGQSNELLSKFNDIRADFLSRFPIFKNKKILAVMGFIVIVMIFLHFSHSPGSSNEVNTAAMQKSQAAAVSPDVTQVNSAVNDMNSKIQSTNTTVNSLHSQVNNIDSSIGALQRDQRQSNQSIRELTNELKKVDIQLAQIAKAQQALSHPKDEAAVKKPAPLVYHIHAVESGRAWIIGTDGSSESVVVGNTINKNYGTVTAINADQGIVYTSSNKMISFGPNDA